MKKVLLTILLLISFFFVFKEGVSAQPACGTDSTVCYNIGTQSICCPGYVCEAGAPGNDYGNCASIFDDDDDDDSFGGKGEPCKPGGSCNTGLYCTSSNLCLESLSDDDLDDISNKDSDILCKNDKGDEGIETAIGCIPVGDSSSFVAFILKWAFGIGGGIAFLLIALSSFQIMTSGGDPKKLQAGKELLTSAISGLLLLIFGVFILRVIGMDILGLGDFGFGAVE